ncbi:MAG TPA: hypothetical protein VLL76_01220, partial [Candidatus Omnitrophota bacterium]|nr:hypothetical protein [Candidatus Omnitrophota bacterium]
HSVAHDQPLDRPAAAYLPGVVTRRRGDAFRPQQYFFRVGSMVFIASNIIAVVPILRLIGGRRG